MPNHGQFEDGKWNAQCDICGRVFKSDKIMTAWDNSKRCEQCWEPRHPQDFVRGVPDIQNTPWARPWIPSLSQATTLNQSSPVGVRISLADKLKLPLAIPLTSYFLATLSGKVGGVEYPNYEVVKVVQFTLTPGLYWTAFYEPAQNGTDHQTWDAGATLTAITEALPV